MGSGTVIILDTHVWIWWLNESTKLSQKAQDTIQSANLVGIPAICCWELAMLVEKKRVVLSMDVQVWMEIAFQNPKVKLLPLIPEIAVLSTRLPGNFHGDPADRLIAAASLFYQVPIVSKDEKIQLCKYLQTIW